MRGKNLKIILWSLPLLMVSTISLAKPAVNGVSVDVHFISDAWGAANNCMQINTFQVTAGDGVSGIIDWNPAFQLPIPNLCGSGAPYVVTNVFKVGYYDDNATINLSVNGWSAYAPGNVITGSASLTFNKGILPHAVYYDSTNTNNKCCVITTPASGSNNATITFGCLPACQPPGKRGALKLLSY